ncbi:SMI1/KNR4 family protein [Streptomyces morookaense]|uniref:SMI1/KNR4 family protein n=1 Tax=Streptomyces morookaense TaxID=1970 RepID=UPI0033CF82F7
MQEWIAELIDKRARESAADSDPEMSPAPKLYAPATTQQLADLEGRAGQLLSPGYREFLSVTDGMDNFYGDMPILGCKDWAGSLAFGRAQSFLEMVLDIDLLEDEGLSSSTRLMPVSVSSDATHGIFLMDTGDAGAERFWWTGNGSSILFRDLPDLFAYVTRGDHLSR